MRYTEARGYLSGRARLLIDTFFDDPLPPSFLDHRSATEVAARILEQAEAWPSGAAEAVAAELEEIEAVRAMVLTKLTKLTKPTGARA